MQSTKVAFLNFRWLAVVIFLFLGNGTRNTKLVGNKLQSNSYAYHIVIEVEPASIDSQSNFASNLNLTNTFAEFIAEFIDICSDVVRFTLDDMLLKILVLKNLLLNLDKDYWKLQSTVNW